MPLHLPIPLLYFIVALAFCIAFSPEDNLFYKTTLRDWVVCILLSLVWPFALLVKFFMILNKL